MLTLLVRFFKHNSAQNEPKLAKGPVKLIKQVKIAHSFLQPVFNQLHVIILSLPM